MTPRTEGALAPTREPPARIRRARDRARTLKAIAAFCAVGAFAVALGLARAAHPGATGDAGGTSSGEPLDPPASFEDRLSRQELFGGGDIGPSDQGGDAPRAGTHTS